MTMNSHLAPAECSLFSADPILTEGDTGSAVMELQKLLNGKGANLQIDGQIGAITLKAIIDFQHQKGLQPDGVVGSLTWGELRRNLPPIRLVNVCRYYNPSSYPHQTLALEWLQQQIPPSVLYEFARQWRNQGSIQSEAFHL